MIIEIYVSTFSSMTIQERHDINKQYAKLIEIKSFYLFTGWRHQDTGKMQSWQSSVRPARDWPHQDLETHLKSSLKEIFLKNSASH